MELSEYKIILFGLGNGENSIAKYILRNYKNIVAVLDNDEDKIGKEVNGVKILEPSSSISYLTQEEVIVVITSLRYHDEMQQQLVRLGWKKEKILVAVRDIPQFNDNSFKASLKGIDMDNPKPTVLNIEFSGFCNCRCMYCPFHGEPNLKEGHKGLMSWKTLDAVIEKIKNIPSIKIVDTTGPGEIFININWFEMLSRLIVNTTIEEVIMYTNGMLLDDDNIGKILSLPAKKISVEVSIDGESPQENDEYRIGSNFEQIKKNILNLKKNIDETGKNIDITITNCYPTTLEEITKYDYLIDSKQNSVPHFLKQNFDNIKVVSQKTFYYGKGTLENFEIVTVKWPKDYADICLNLFNRLAINYQGELLRCSCGQAGIQGIADVFNDDILNVWYTDEEMNRARTNFKNNILEEDFCSGCPGKGKGEYGVLIKKKKNN